MKPNPPTRAEKEAAQKMWRSQREKNAGESSGELAGRLPAFRRKEPKVADVLGPTVMTEPIL